MRKEELIKKLREVLSKNYSRNVLAVIQIGSSNQKITSISSDIDFIFVIKHPSEKLNLFLKKLFKMYKKPIDPSFIYIYKQKDSRTLFGTHGYYMIDHLVKGRVIFGENPFTKRVKKIPFLQIQKELISKVKEYLYERKKWYLTQNIINPKEQYKLANRICKSILDLLIIDGTILNEESSSINYVAVFQKAIPKYAWANFVYAKIKKIWQLKLLNERELSKLIFIFEKISYEANKNI